MIQFPSPQQQQLPAPKLDDTATTFKEVSFEENRELIGSRRMLNPSVFNNRMREIDYDVVRKLQTEANVESFHFLLANISSYIFFHNNLWYGYTKQYGQHKAMFTAETPEDMMLGINRKFENRRGA
jgi:hypothetical protein